MSRNVRRVGTAGLLVVVALVAAAALMTMRPAAAASRSVIAHVGSPLGDDVFELAAFEGTETVSRLFSYRLDLLSSSPAVSPSRVIGTPMTVSVVGGEERTFAGLVAAFTYAGPDDRPGVDRYEALVVPNAWLLTQAADLRIFQDATAPEIVAAVFAEFGVDRVDYRLGDDPYPTAACTVQYRETDFAFVSRLMEEEGIFFYFEHDERGHTLVLGDANPTVPGPAAVFGDDIGSWSRRAELTPGRVTLRDWNFVDPADDLTVAADSLRSNLDPDRYEIYDYPAGYGRDVDGARKAGARIAALDARHETVSGEGSVLSFGPGSAFTLSGHPRASEDGRYLLTSVVHRIGPAAGGDLEYSNTFEAIPAEVPFRPPRVTPQPVVQGPQTAIVVGPSGEEIWSDEHGRVKVQFHWDRGGRADENSSCWIRVAQNWAGGRWGTTFIPRIGSEVVVDFLEGDPDRPLITGRVYNADLAPPHRWKAAR